MIDILKNRLYSTYLKVIGSIAFYPSIIASAMFLLALTLLELEDTTTTKFLIENFPYLVINDSDTARAILSTLIGSILSLTVFSFSMVMVLLNQASSNFSPRLLPGLISDKKNQLVLGTYLGTIVYNIIILISISPSEEISTLNGFSILLGIVFGIVCLALFVFFIHTISTSIQINNILSKIFEQAKARLNYLRENERLHAKPVEIDEGWTTVMSSKAGYYQGVNLEGIRSFAAKHGLGLKVLCRKGDYVLPNMPIVTFSKQLEKEDVEQIESMLIYSNSHDVRENYVIGVRQITEVGVKAMSPGINDPGTAVMTIDYLTELLSLRMEVHEHEVYADEEQSYTVELATVDFADLIYNVLAAYRQYCKHDIILMRKLANMLLFLQKQECKEDAYINVLSQEIEILRVDVDENIVNEADRLKLQEKLERVTERMI